MTMAQHLAMSRLPSQIGAFMLSVFAVMAHGAGDHRRYGHGALHRGYAHSRGRDPHGARGRCDRRRAVARDARRCDWCWSAGLSVSLRRCSRHASLRRCSLVSGRSILSP